MRKRNLLLVGTMLAVCTLVGCGSSSNDITDTDVSIEENYDEIDSSDDTISNDDNSTSEDTSNTSDEDALNLSLHECNHSSYEEYQITSIIGNIKDIMVNDEDELLILTDNGLYLFGLRASDGAEEAKNAAHGLLKLSSKTDLELVALEDSSALVKDSNEDYFVYYTVGEETKYSFADCNYSDDCVLECNIGKIEDFGSIVNITPCFGDDGYDWTCVCYLSASSNELRYYQSDEFTREGNYMVVIDNLYENNDPNEKYHTGYGLLTARTHEDITEGYTTERINYSISSYTNARDNRLFFVSNNKLYLRYDMMSETLVCDFPVDENGVGYIDYGEGNDIGSVDNVEFVYKSKQSANLIAFKKIDDNSNISVFNISAMNRDKQTVKNIDLSEVGHTTDDIKDIFIADETIYTIFENNDVYKFEESGDSWSATKLDSLTDAINGGYIKLVTVSDDERLIVVDNNNLIYSVH